MTVGVHEIEAEPWSTLNFYPGLLYLCPIPVLPLNHAEQLLVVLKRVKGSRLKWRT